MCEPGQLVKSNRLISICSCAIQQSRLVLRAFYGLSLINSVQGLLGIP